MKRCSAPVALSIAFGLFDLGCASQSDNQGRLVRELGDQVRRLQASTDRLEERLAALENAQRHEPMKPQSSTSLSEVPNLPIVKLAPEANGAPTEPRAAATDAEEPRPLIVGEGNRVETRASGDAGASNAQQRRPKDKTPVESATSKRSNGTVDAGKK